MEDKKNSIKSISTNYGLYLGSLLVLLTVIIYAIDLGLMTNIWFSIIALLIIIGFGIVSVAKSKSLLDGFISFKQSFTAFFITILVGVLISTIVSYILFNFIDTNAAEVIKQNTIETTINFMEGFGAPVDAIADAVDEMEKQNQFSIGNILKGLAGQLVFYSIIGLIVAAIMKKNPDAE